MFLFCFGFAILNGVYNKVNHIRGIPRIPESLIFMKILRGKLCSSIWLKPQEQTTILLRIFHTI